ncbi:hypothetical protein [Gryllotalpicola koreensis]|uniref:hypothetical protein n=1 Tax=Gryllotalpicola koreensis TaxID=993086 RepID=UPI0031DD84B3
MLIILAAPLACREVPGCPLTSIEATSRHFSASPLLPYLACKHAAGLPKVKKLDAA